MAVLPTFTVPGAANALRGGAVHVIAREADSARLTRVVEEVASGSVTLPIEVLRATFLVRPEGRHPRPSDEELIWLRALAAGDTVSRLAADHHHSERALYRRLRELYQRLGVRGRTQALMLARDEGWL